MITFTVETFKSEVDKQILYKVRMYKDDKLVVSETTNNEDDIDACKIKLEEKYL